MTRENIPALSLTRTEIISSSDDGNEAPPLRRASNIPIISAPPALAAPVLMRALTELIEEDRAANSEQSTSSAEMLGQSPSLVVPATTQGSTASSSHASETSLAHAASEASTILVIPGVPFPAASAEVVTSIVSQVTTAGDAAPVVASEALSEVGAKSVMPLTH